MVEQTTARGLPARLRADIERAGYYPALVVDATADAIAGEEVLAHLVHQETTFDGDEVRRHVTVLALTPSRLVIGHTDDHAEQGAPGQGAAPVAMTSAESVDVGRIRSLVVTRVVPDPERYVPGTPPQEVTLTVAWGAVSRVDLEPAGCSDPECDADHGYTGSATADDLSLRISAAAEGPEAVTAALAFAADLSAATTRSRGR
ncbi:DUF5998 family protein [Vallicoccus soli]|uniref:Phosphodiesterase n=1 Tax=Vallicoccus soli TaxID=2339232 RepID=A0A3A3ZK80_9ACTN|nr:DUF5998 family protein [Vallicoccus soli]RJK96274.1 phosphodiesterase [Vallicoccus soli]